MNKSLGTAEHLQIQAIIDAAEPAGSRLRRLYRLKWFAAPAIALLAIVAWSVAQRQPAVAYTTGPVTAGELVVTVTATGSVQPTKKVDVSSELSGTIKNVLVDFNSKVSAGQLLAELDPDTWKATADSSKAKIGSDESQSGGGPGDSG
jgi:HlyD family secretion protein